jgi:hypothetical protein
MDLKELLTLKFTIGGNMSEIMRKIYLDSMKEWELEKQELFENFRVFWDGDYDRLKDIVKETYKNKPFRTDPANENKSSLDYMVIQHQDIIQNTTSRLTAGIYDEDPIRELRIYEGGRYKTDDNLSEVLEMTNFNNVMKEALQTAIFFNTVVLHPVARDKTLDIDILTPDQFAVKTKVSYHRLDKIMIERVDRENNPILIYWSDTEHYMINEKDKAVPVEGSKNKTNPYKILPFEVLRIKKGLDFYGEPDWNLYLNQIAIDLKLSDLDNAEILTRNGFLHGINTNIGLNQSIGPGILIQTKHDDPNKQVSLGYVTNDVDFGDQRDGVDWRIKSSLRSRGIVGSAASTEETAQSGVSKEKDETMILEQRRNNIALVYPVEIKLLQKIRTIYNWNVSQGNIKGQKLNETGEFAIKYRMPESRPSNQEIREDLKFQLENNVLDIIDLIIKYYEVDEAEAIEILEKKKDRQENNAELLAFFEAEGNTQKRIDNIIGIE